MSSEKSKLRLQSSTDRFSERAKYMLNESSGGRCAVRYEMYGGMPGGVAIKPYRELSAGASNIIEAAHCILGSVGRLFRGKTLNKDWIRSEMSHIKEELRIIKNDVKEYSKDIYLKQLDESDRKVDEMVENLFEVCPKIMKLAKKNKKNFDPTKVEEIDEVVENTYDLMWLFSSFLKGTAQDIKERKEQGEKLRNARNPFSQLRAYKTLDELEIAVKRLDKVA